MALTGDGLRVVIGLALYAVSVALVGFDDGQLVAAAAHIYDTGDARGEVRRIVFVGAGGKGGLEAVSGEEVAVHELGDRVGLVTVGHNGALPQGQHGVVNNQVRIFQLGRVSGHRADAALDGLKHTVAAVGAAAHDPVGDEHLAAVGALSQHNAAARILIPGKIFVKVLFHNLYLVAAHHGQRLGQ